MSATLRERAQLAAIVVLVVLAVVGGLAMLRSTPDVPRSEGIPAEVLKVSNRTSVPSPPLPATVVDAGPDLQSAGRCGGTPPFRGTKRVFAENGAEVVVHLPGGYDGSTPRPTVVVFHRAFDSAERMITEEIVATSEVSDFVVLGFNAAKPTGWSTREYESSAVAILWAHEEFCLDRSRLFVVGNDQGARITANLACMMPVSGTAVTFDRSVRGCRPVVATSRLRVYGLRDKNVPVKGGASCSVIEGASSSAADIRDSWMKLMKCDGRTKAWGDYPSGTCKQWDCDRDAVYVECALDSGHYWPNDPGPMIPTTPCAVEDPETPFPTMPAIWDFFVEHGHVITDDELAKVRE